jgi:uncharacterized protein (DUF433 family)
MQYSAIVSIDYNAFTGQPLFVGTRVPIESLFDQLEEAVTIDGFLEDFLTITKEQAVASVDMKNTNLC